MRNIKILNIFHNMKKIIKIINNINKLIKSRGFSYLIFYHYIYKYLVLD